MRRRPMLFHAFTSRTMRVPAKQRPMTAPMVYHGLSFSVIGRNGMGGGDPGGTGGAGVAFDKFREGDCGGADGEGSSGGDARHGSRVTFVELALTQGACGGRGGAAGGRGGPAGGSCGGLTLKTPAKRR